MPVTQQERDEIRQEMLADQYSEDLEEKRLHNDLAYAMGRLEVDGYSLVDIDDLLTKLSHKLSEYGHEVNRKEILENLWVKNLNVKQNVNVKQNGLLYLSLGTVIVQNV